MTTEADSFTFCDFIKTKKINGSIGRRSSEAGAPNRQPNQIKPLRVTGWRSRPSRLPTSKWVFYGIFFAFSQPYNLIELKSEEFLRGTP
jgi:hypothetical protein